MPRRAAAAAAADYPLWTTYSGSSSLTAAVVGSAVRPHASESPSSPVPECGDAL